MDGTGQAAVIFCVKTRTTLWLFVFAFGYCRLYFRCTHYKPNVMRNLYASLIFAFAVVSCGNPGGNNTEKTAPEAEAETTENVTPAAPEVEENKRQLRHVVLFKFKETATPEDIKSVEDAFAALPAKISEIKGFEFGTNNSPEGLDKGFTHCFLLTFDSEEDRAIYLPHPDHKKFGEALGPHLEDVLVVDYWTH